MINQIQHIELNNFMSSCKVTKNNEYTHTISNTQPYSYYNIPENQIDNFLSLYSGTINEKINPHITECFTDYGPLLVVINFNMPYKNNIRKYTTDDIKSIISVINDNIKCEELENMTAFVCEKDKPSLFTRLCGEKEWKDGFYIYYPYIIFSKNERQTVIDNTIIQMNSQICFFHIPSTNDNVIINISGLGIDWPLYKSNKNKGPIYELTKIYNNNLEEIDLCQYSDNDLVRLLSVRRNKYNFDSESNDDLLDMFMMKSLDVEEDELKFVGYDLVKKLMGLITLPKNDVFWEKIGRALYNINSELLNVFKKFTRQISSLYSDKDCDILWSKKMKIGCGIDVLYYFASYDSPYEFYDIMVDNLYDMITNERNLSEHCIAKIMCMLYRYCYRCVNMSNDVWYEFKENNWCFVESGHTLCIKMSEEVTDKLQFIRNNHYGNLQDSDTKVKAVNKLIINLKTNQFKNKIMKSCKGLFYDMHFMNELNCDRMLIGFNNGVYDLDKRLFRPGVPSDMLSMSVGYNYKEYSFDHEYILGIKQFFEQVQVDIQMREYILLLLASYLDGHVRDEQFVLWCGDGGNGKSKVVQLFQASFGDYWGVMPCSVLTRKKNKERVASPELAAMKSKRFVVFQEPESDDEIQIGLMKEMTGGDQITARPLLKNMIKFKPQFKILLICNKLPHIPATDLGTWRRIRVAHWNSEFVDNPTEPHQFKRDAKLSEKLQKWKKAFMWYLITVYYPLYREKGLCEPEHVTIHTKKYKEVNDMFLKYIEDQLVITGNENDMELVNVVYKAIEVWAGENIRYKHNFNKKSFIYYLSENSYNISSDDKMWIGVKFKN